MSVAVSSVTTTPTPTEAQFQAQVIELAQLLGWLVYHTYDSRRCEPGYPDVTLVHPTKQRFLMRELKSERGRLRAEQLRWLDALDSAGIDADVWRPSQWDAIVETLR